MFIIVSLVVVMATTLIVTFATKEETNNMETTNIINKVQAIIRRVIAIVDGDVSEYITPSTGTWTITYAAKLGKDISATNNYHVPMI